MARRKKKKEVVVVELERQLPRLSEEVRDLLHKGGVHDDEQHYTRKKKHKKRVEDE